MKNLAKIDKFYFVLGLSLLILSVMFIYSFRGIFQSFITAYETNTPSKQDNKVDMVKLKQAEDLLFNKNSNDFIDATVVVATPSPTEVPTPTPTVTLETTDDVQ